MTHTQRTMKALKKAGLIPAIVEKYNYHAKREGGFGVRQDLFGFIDIVALDPVHGRIIGVQSTGTAYASHLRKILEDRMKPCLAWLMAGGEVELWAWRKVKVKRGGKAKVWEPRIKCITLEDFGMDF